MNLKGEIFFTSDVHFGHTNIIPYCKRPFTSVEEMDQALVDNWNAEVTNNDTVFHLGDWAFHNYERIGQLKGNIISVPGNHDHERAKKILPFLVNGFTEEIAYLKIDYDRSFVLCHYPLETWRRDHRYHLHGHTHGMFSKIDDPRIKDYYGGYRGNIPRRLDVGIDALKLYKPAHIDTIMQLLEDNEYAPTGV